MSMSIDSETGLARGAQEEGAPFVLELCEVASPVAIPQPRAGQPSRFTFFCSRDQRGAQEKWRLHMGYFPTRAEAEKWLGVLQRLYPEACVCPAEITCAPEHHTALHLAPRREPL